MDLATLIERSTKRFAHRTAVEHENGQTTYAELGDRVTRLSNGLRQLGLSPGDRVLDLQTNGITCLESDLAIRCAGLTRVALNYRLHPSDWERIADDCGARALIYDSKFYEKAATLVDALDTVVIGEGPGRPYESLINDANSSRLEPLNPESLCGLHYSSGTTGRPKGAQRTHRNWMASITSIIHDVIGRVPSPGDKYVHAGPMTHTSGLFVLPFLAGGASQLILPSWDEDGLCEAVSERAATHTALVPTMISRLLSHGQANREILHNLQMLAYAGAPMSAEHARRAHQELSPQLVQYYGLVEAIPPVTVLDANDHQAGVEKAPELLSSAGRPAFGVRLQVVDEQGKKLPDGETGEVLTAGDHVMPGYWNPEGREDLSKDVRGGWLHTGDLGRIQDGRLWLVDRRGDMIISGGYNIYPREVEEVIATHPAISEVCVVGISDSEWGQKVVAVATQRPGESTDEVAILDHCRMHLASYKKPTRVHFVDRLPLNSTGKVSKKSVREVLEANHGY